MPSYIIVDSEQEAIDRSRKEWEAILGRPKKPEDVTEFLWSYSVGVDGKAALDISDGEGKVVTEGKDKDIVLDSALPIANWPAPTDD